MVCLFYIGHHGEVGIVVHGRSKGRRRGGRGRGIVLLAVIHTHMLKPVNHITLLNKLIRMYGSSLTQTLSVKESVRGGCVSVQCKGIKERVRQTSNRVTRRGPLCTATSTPKQIIYKIHFQEKDWSKVLQIFFR